MVAVAVALVVAVIVTMAMAVLVARMRVRVVASAMKVAVVPVGKEMTVSHLPSASFLATFLGSTVGFTKKKDIVALVQNKLRM